MEINNGIVEALRRWCAAKAPDVQVAHVGRDEVNGYPIALHVAFKRGDKYHAVKVGYALVASIKSEREAMVFTDELMRPVVEALQ